MTQEECAGRPLRVLVFLEARTVSGAVKPLLEFAREAEQHYVSHPLDLTLVLYAREGQQDRLSDMVQAQGIKVTTVAERHPLDLRVVPQLREIARVRRPDIIWTNNTKSHFLVTLAGLHRTAKWIAFHHGYTKEAWRTKVYNQLDRWSLPHAERVVTVCNDFARQLEARGVSAERLRVVRNPIRVAAPVSAIDTARLREELGLNNARVVISIGRLSREKGHADLLRAIALCATEEQDRQLALIIVGDGPERYRLQALSSELGLDKIVRFAGHQDDVRPYYALADAFVLPSHSEGSPNVLLEAMAAGVPMVATTVGGIPEVLSHELNALLVPKQDIVQLAAAIQRVLNDYPLRERFAQEATKIVAQHDPQSYFHNVMSVFQEVMSEAPAR